MLKAKQAKEKAMPPVRSHFLAVVALAGALTGVLASPLSAQLQLPGLPGVGGVVSDVTGTLDTTVTATDRLVAREARRLLKLRERAFDSLLRRHGDAIERDAAGDLARRGELLATAPSAAQVSALEQAGFSVLGREEIAGLEIAVVRFAVPQGVTLAQAQQRAAEIAPGLELSADHLHFTAGEAVGSSPAALLPASLGAGASGNGPAVGVIDGGAGASLPVAATKGFAQGAPAPSDHGSAVTSLLLSHGVRQVWVADVYGRDPAGGNALAIAKALGWLTANGCRIVTVSLVGPRNALVARAVASAQRRGVIVLAAVGNDGPAAPPAFPASYAGVLAITGTDRKGRALIEAGRAAHLDYAAPGAEVIAADARGRRKAWRGTSFATPLAAARLAATLDRSADWRASLDREARDLGRKGPDDTYGRGLLCEPCARRK